MLSWVSDSGLALNTPLVVLECSNVKAQDIGTYGSRRREAAERGGGGDAVGWHC